MRIGDLLMERRAVRHSELTLAVQEQARSGRRLCSLLISRGAIEFDDAARALGDQKGVPCALAKHLAHRDVAAANLIPAELGRVSCALPIGRTSSGALIVCVRDPDPNLLSALERAANTKILMVVTPATRLEHLIAAAYGPPPHDEFDIDLDSAVDLDPLLEPPLPDVDMFNPDSVRLALSDLDDVRVAKDPSQSGIVIPSSSSSSPSGSTRNRTAPHGNQRIVLPPSFEATRHGLEQVVDREDATELALAYIVGRWPTGLVVAIRESTAIGYRGHQLDLEGEIAQLSLPLTFPSTIQRVVMGKRMSTQTPASPAQTQLTRVLRNPIEVAVAPILVGGEVIAAIAIGAADESSTGDLELLATALGTAYERIRRL